MLPPDVVVELSDSPPGVWSEFPVDLREKVEGFVLRLGREVHEVLWGEAEKRTDGFKFNYVFIELCRLNVTN